MNIRYILVGFMVVAMATWVLSGELSDNTITANEQGADESVSGTASQAEDVALVRAVKSRADRQTVYLDVRGQTKANRVVQVQSEVAGKIEQLPGEKGRRVKKGDALCRLAIDSRRNEYTQALAELKSAQLEFDGSVDLNRKGLQSEILLARARAALEQSKTRARQTQLALEKTEIVAPFNGVVASQPVEVGDFLQRGDTCIGLMEIDPILVVGQVAEKDIHQLAMDDSVTIELIAGRPLTGKVSYIGHSPDMSTRTFPVEVTVANPGAEVRAGMTATMHVTVGVEDVHLISPASMVLDKHGRVGVRIVDSENRARFKVIEVVGEGPAGVRVKGLPDEVNLITVGQEDVLEGQVVKMDFTPIAALVRN